MPRNHTQSLLQQAVRQGHSGRGLLPSPPSQAFTTSLIKAESEGEKEEAKVTTGIMEPLIVMIIQL